MFRSVAELQAAILRFIDEVNSPCASPSFNRDLRGLLQVAPDYMKPVNYDTRKLLRLLGPQRMTSYADGIGETLTWISSSR